MMDLSTISLNDYRAYGSAENSALYPPIYIISNHTHDNILLFAQSHMHFSRKHVNSKVLLYETSLLKNSRSAAVSFSRQNLLTSCTGTTWIMFAFHLKKSLESGKKLAPPANLS